MNAHTRFSERQEYSHICHLITIPIAPGTKPFNLPVRVVPPWMGPAVLYGVPAVASKYGKSYYDMCSPVGASSDMRPMCQAQTKALQACPEFKNSWCYQDLGGPQQLRAPCPAHLVCHYCLGLNPLHCQ